MVAFEAVTKTFGGNGKEPAFTALAGVDFVVPRGGISGIIGRSGAGKSTMIRLVNGLERPTSGKVVVDGVDVGALDEGGLRSLRRSVGMIFQHFNLLSSRTAYDNVALPLEISGVSKDDIKRKVGPLLDLVGLGDKAKRYPAELSGGQKQRVGIARALATEPKLLLSDEATSALDPETTQSILELLKRINAELGLTVLLITHEMEVVKTIASQVAVIDKGLIVEQGSTFDIFTHPRHETTRSLLSSAVGVKLPHWVTSGLKSEPAAGDRILVRLVFFGDTAFQPLTARLVAEIGPDVNILAGTIEEIAGAPFGSLVVSYPATPDVLARAKRVYDETGLTTEVLGYVA
ncbi:MULTISPECIES: methionine ABC transporter ATP-binding protein [Rhizobium/Agrobacterium group]|uniref:Cell division ATP-binding protein FtsE n=1 Tax=Rhizobium rhizogenes TaxID=359 RepID=A0AA92C7J1_RHIRH|nr:MULTISPECIES: methionine ABC transporter ATP-binding protein [Rhizobium/Agrobacterium group]KQM33895.1 methionine ABC transporter ATP-binding protein [Rhizobium sp. Leaf202]KQN85956.1 methionine ABC transporter ATP-binding protein [Rhizobium sp. Leaf68]PVE68877.1 methionine ABC transporter ATP-binding protein [Agrobacterium tumefaciens]PVE78625.1 methionine ABC transporter ATP-binding protein [Sphingomonas sp. TPD3009]PVE57446.1 methionine ABC transporter ATP-binding protein [Rhizobium rhiz